MKKITGILALGLLATALTGCNKTPDHVHEYKEVKVAATKDTPAKTQLVCECGDVESEEVGVYCPLTIIEAYAEMFYGAAVPNNTYKEQEDMYFTLAVLESSSEGYTSATILDPEFCGLEGFTTHPSFNNIEDELSDGTACHVTIQTLDNIVVEHLAWDEPDFYKTTDKTVDSKKTYYTYNESTKEYNKVETPVDADIANYFEYLLTFIWQVASYILEA